MTRNEEDIVKNIQELYEAPVSVFDGTYTKTTQFLLPLIELNVRKKTIFTYFRNAYLEDAGKEHEPLDCPIFVLFATPQQDHVEWIRIYESLISKPEYLIDYTIGTNEKGEYLNMFVFEVPKEHVDIYSLFKRGKYSKFPDWYKKNFPQKVKKPNGEVSESIVWGALHKSENLKREVEKQFEGYGENTLELDPEKDEYWEKPRAHREVYRYSEDLKNKHYEQLKTLGSR